MAKTTNKMKVCRRCGPQPIERFGKNKAEKDGLHRYCKRCRREEMAERFKQMTPEAKENRYRKVTALKDKRREFVLRYLLVHPCVDCGESDPIVLEFDHVRGIKSANVSALVNSHGDLNKIQAEIAKCDVVCRNCHMRRETHRRHHHVLRMLEEIDG